MNRHIATGGHSFCPQDVHTLNDYQFFPVTLALELALGDRWLTASPFLRSEWAAQEVRRRHQPRAGKSAPLTKLIERRADLVRGLVVLRGGDYTSGRSSARLHDELVVVNEMVRAIEAGLETEELAHG